MIYKLVSCGTLYWNYILSLMKVTIHLPSSLFLVTGSSSLESLLSDSYSDEPELSFDSWFFFAGFRLKSQMSEGYALF